MAAHVCALNRRRGTARRPFISRWTPQDGPRRPALATTKADVDVRSSRHRRGAASPQGARELLRTCGWHREAPNGSPERFLPLELAGEVLALEFHGSSSSGARESMNSRLQGTESEIGEVASLEETLGTQGRKRQGWGCSVPSPRCQDGRGGAPGRAKEGDRQETYLLA